MSRNLIAVYPGTFDPITLGHEDMVRRALRLFDRVIVAVAIAHHKKTLFSFEERLAMVNESIRQWPGASAEPFEGLTTRFAAAHGGQAMVRGLRAVTDFDYEFQLAGMNRDLAPEIETVFLAPGAGHQFISSTLVREIAMLDGDASKFVAPHVWRRLVEKKNGKG
ncbi:MAG: pantetheine-phosphate adenylyltransferase [Burkholderiaceae bacterium]|jgi:pantetheine-phosphate adenylyltransferase|nr:pantetheine-phosphate adenylyltransferase [Burkholderiaceae bacterium]